MHFPPSARDRHPGTRGAPAHTTTPPGPRRGDPHPPGDWERGSPGGASCASSGPGPRRGAGSSRRRGRRSHADVFGNRAQDSVKISPRIQQSACLSSGSGRGNNNPDRDFRFSNVPLRFFVPIYPRSMEHLKNKNPNPDSHFSPRILPSPPNV